MTMTMTMSEELLTELRCDKDVAEKAVAAIQTANGILAFCGHHLRELTEPLLKYELIRLPGVPDGEFMPWPYKPKHSHE